MSFDKIFDLTAGVYFYFYSNTNTDNVCISGGREGTYYYYLYL